MESFDSELTRKPSITAFNKIDLIEERPVKVDGFNDRSGSPCFISAATGENIDEFLNSLSIILFKND
jgi:50S ribosomal subunit-associated GTPase HflX